MTQTKERDTLAKLRADMTTANQKATQLSAIVLNHQETLEVSRQEYIDQQAENLLIHEQLDAHYEFHCDLKARVASAEAAVADQQKSINAIKLAQKQADCVHDWRSTTRGYAASTVVEAKCSKCERFRGSEFYNGSNSKRLRQAARWFRKLPKKGVK